MFVSNDNVLSAGGSRSFSGEQFHAALVLAARLKQEGHAVVYDETVPGPGEARTLWVTHYRNCLKCVGIEKEK